jgi:tRNA dimethylallyltransferase
MSAYHSTDDRPKMVVILGPTATGKSDLAVELALQFDGETISADSRQVYRGLNIGTGKITHDEMRGVPHHLLDVTRPHEQFTVADYKLLAEKAVKSIVGRGKLPILCGGTGFYISAVIDDVVFPEVPPNTGLRDVLENQPLEALREQLGTLDPERAQTIDTSNRRRLIRAIEIAETLGKVPKPEAGESRYNTLMVSIAFPDKTLRQRIRDRLHRRLQSGMIEEVQKLHTQGLSWQRLDALGLEYRYIAQHLQGSLTREELETVLEQKIWQYAKRQKTWFKRDKRIQWFTPSSVEGFTPTDYTKIHEMIRSFVLDKTM